MMPIVRVLFSEMALKAVTRNSGKGMKSRGAAPIAERFPLLGADVL